MKQDALVRGAIVLIAITLLLGSLNGQAWAQEPSSCKNEPDSELFPGYVCLVCSPDGTFGTCSPCGGYNCSSEP